jgi:hypothetical protein
MRTLLLTFAGAAVVSAVALAMPHADAATPAGAPTTAGNTVAAELVALKCLQRRVCRPGQGCAWRKMCKRW